MFLQRTLILLVVPACAFAFNALAQEHAPTPSIRVAAKPVKSTAKAVVRPHRVAIHVDDNDAKVMNLALNNTKNILEYYKAKGERVEIEVVTYGPGLHMLRTDTSPVKQRIEEMTLAAPEVTFVACANTQANMSKQEGNAILLLREARLVPSGVVRLMELQERGYSYIRPSGR